MDCPCCRQPVAMFFDSFPDEEERPCAAACDALAREQKAMFLREYNRRFSGEPLPLMQQAKDVPNMLRRMWRDLVSAGFLALLMKV